jgi:hypothetical protein
MLHRLIQAACAETTMTPNAVTAITVIHKLTHCRLPFRFSGCQILAHNRLRLPFERINSLLVSGKTARGVSGPPCSLCCCGGLGRLASSPAPNLSAQTIGISVALH